MAFWKDLDGFKMVDWVESFLGYSTGDNTEILICSSRDN